MSLEKDCIFCKIVRGEIPANRIYEDKEFLAFLDIKPISKGHTLVIPKHHCKNLLDFPKSASEKLAGSENLRFLKAEETELLELIKKVASAVVKATNADGFNLGMNNGKAAGQVIHHAHFHIIPRFDNDGLHNWPNKDTSKEELEQVQKKIVSFL
jgi:histidine triad (HIT) family protein